MRVCGYERGVEGREGVWCVCVNLIKMFVHCLQQARGAGHLQTRGGCVAGMRYVSMLPGQALYYHHHQQQHHQLTSVGTCSPRAS